MVLDSAFFSVFKIQMLLNLDYCWCFNHTAQVMVGPLHLGFPMGIGALMGVVGKYGNIFGYG